MGARVAGDGAQFCGVVWSSAAVAGSCTWRCSSVVADTAFARSLESLLWTLRDVFVPSDGHWSCVRVPPVEVSGYEVEVGVLLIRV